MRFSRGAGGNTVHCVERRSRIRLREPVDSESQTPEPSSTPSLGTCTLCLQTEVRLLKSHFVSRKLYYTGKAKLGFANLLESGVNPTELTAHLLCRWCEARFSVNGEEVDSSSPPMGIGTIRRGYATLSRGRRAVPEKHGRHSVGMQRCRVAASLDGSDLLRRQDV